MEAFRMRLCVDSPSALIFFANSMTELVLMSFLYLAHVDQIGFLMIMNFVGCDLSGLAERG